MVENEPDITGPSECMYADVVGTVVCTNYGRLVYPKLIRGADFTRPISLFPPLFLTFRRPCISGGEKMCIANNNNHDDCNFLFLSSGFFTREFEKKNTKFFQCALKI